MCKNRRGRGCSRMTRGAWRAPAGRPRRTGDLCSRRLGRLDCGVSGMDRPSEVSPDHSGVILPPPLIYVVFLLIGVGLQRYVPLPRLPIGSGRFLGAVLALSALVLTASSVRRFWASGTSVIPVRPTTALVI